MRQAIVLAGGKGTRLAARLGGRPKPLVDVGGRPLLEHILLLLQRHHFAQTLVLVSHHAAQILDFVAERGGFGMDVRCIDDGEPRGTAGATLAILDQLAEEFLVVYGDTMLDVDLDRFHAFHTADRSAAATLLLHPNDHPRDSDLVEVDDKHRIVAFHPHPRDTSRDYPNLVNAALYWVKREALRPYRQTCGPLDFGKDLFPAMLADGNVLRGYNSPEYIKDCGTPERLDDVIRRLESGQIAHSSLRYSQPVVFLDRDGTINYDVGHLNHPDQLRLFPGVAQAVRRLNESEYRVCVATNQPVIARGECSFQTLQAIHNRLETLLGRDGAYLDRIYFCPHHPHRGYVGERPELKIKCACRKPATGMIDQAAADFNLYRTRSWFVGDSTLDIETARRAGLRSLIVETGFQGRDGRYPVEADYTASDLADAVRFILDVHPRLLALCESIPLDAGAVVLIGGRRRSEISTFAAGIAETARQRGLIVHRIRMERLRTGDSPDQAESLSGGLDALRQRIDRLAQRVPDALTSPFLQSAPFAVAPMDVVVVEGAGALALAPDAACRVRRFWLETEEEGRKARAAKVAVEPLQDEEAGADVAQRITLDEVLA